MKLLSLALGMFAVGVDGFVVAGILRPISSDLGVSVASAGLLETSFALSIAVLAPLLVTALGSVPPRLTLTASLAAFTVFNILAAVSPWFWLLLVARVLAGLSVGVFQAVAPMVASMTAPKDGQGSALAVVTSGMTAGIVLGVPIGIFVTNQFDWRFSFWLVALLGAVAAIACSTQFAEVPGPPPTPLRERVSVAAHPSVLLMLGSITVWMLGGYVLYVFMGPMLQGVANVSGSALPWIFFGFGVASVVGNLAGGRALDRWGAAAALIVGLTGGGLGLFLTSLLHTSQTGVILAVLLWSTAGWMLTPPQQARLLRLGPHLAPVLMSLNASAMYLGMGLGGLVGGLVLRTGALHDLGWVGGIFEVIAIVMVVIQHRRRMTQPLTPRSPVTPTQE